MGTFKSRIFLSAFLNRGLNGNEKGIMCLVLTG